MREEREIRPKWPAIYTFLGRGKWWQPSNNIGCLANNIGRLANNIGKQYRLFGEQYRQTVPDVWQTTLVVWWSNNVGDLFQIQSF
jgi:hypothetical protein